MSSPKAAQRVAAQNVTASLATLLSPARAEASRTNGAKSRGPITPEGKARSAQNALKHGLRAERFTVVGDEDEDEYDAHEQALLDELAPEGALQTLLAERIARAAWRLARADTIEAMLFDRLADTSDLGLAVIRDGHGTRAFDTLLRYRGAAQAELFRTLRTLKALQAERAAQQTAPTLASCEQPSEPEGRANPRRGMPAGQADRPRIAAQADAPVRSAERTGPWPCPPARQRHETPNGPEARRNPGETAPHRV